MLTFAKEVAFMADDQFVVTGGDNGRLYIWETLSGKVCLEAGNGECVGGR